jgi:hypothetical protein
MWEVDLLWVGFQPKLACCNVCMPVISLELTFVPVECCESVLGNAPAAFQRHIHKCRLERRHHARVSMSLVQVHFWSTPVLMITLATASLVTS